MLQSPDAVMLFAAGYGTRMLPLSKTCPKPLIRVLDRALIDYALDLARAVGPRRIVTNLHYLAPQIEAHLHGSEVITRREMPQILETGGGLRAALPQLGSSFVWTMNTDNIWHGPNPLRLALGSWDSSVMDALLVCVPIPHTRGYAGGGDFSCADDGQLSWGGDLVYGGVQIIKTDLLSTFAAQAFSLRCVWEKMGAAGRLYGLCYPGIWCDVGHPGGIAVAEEVLRDEA